MNYEKIFNKIQQLSANTARIIAVSKYASDEDVACAIAAGCLEFGENKVQNLSRRSELFKQANWHMIGNLQSNKINMMIKAKPILWQSCTSLEQAIAVDSRLDSKLECLIEVNAANEDSKCGAKLELGSILYEQINAKCQHLRAVGLMCIGAHSDDKAAIKASFIATRKEFERCKGAKICSMGMSSDYEIAIECGSNLVRIGSAIFN